MKKNRYKTSFNKKWITLLSLFTILMGSFGNSAIIVADELTNVNTTIVSVNNEEKSEVETVESNEEFTKDSVNNVNPPSSEKGKEVQIGESANANDSPKADNLNEIPEGDNYLTPEKIDEQVSAMMGDLFVIGSSDTGKKILSSANPMALMGRATGNSGANAIKYYGSTYVQTPYITIDGAPAWCIEAAKPWPINQEYIESVYNNEGVYNILYYAVEKNMAGAQGTYVDVFAALNIFLGFVYYGQNQIKADANVAFLLSKANNPTAPRGRFDLTNKNQTATWNTANKRQETEWYATSTDGTNITQTLTVPANISAITSDGRTLMSGTHTLAQNIKFKLVANATYSGTVTIPVSTNLKFQSPLVFTPKNNNNVQKLVSTGFHKDPIAPISIKATFKAQVGNVTIKKLDLSDKDKVLPATFEATRLDTNEKKTIKTNSGGYADWYGLPNDVTVRYVEVIEPDGYLIDSTPIDVKVKAGETIVVEHYNAPAEQSVELVKVDTETTPGKETPLPNVSFDLYRKEGTTDVKISEHKTNAAGSISVSGLRVGQYFFREVAPLDGYLPLKGDVEFKVIVADHGKKIELKAINDRVPPTIGTTAMDKETNSKNPSPENPVTIVDAVSYRYLIPGKEYTVKGVLMDKATKKPLLVGGKEVRAEKVFTPTTAHGSVSLEFTFDGSALAGKEVVVFEKVLRNGKEVAVHEDILDSNQTVEFRKPALKTTATDKLTGSKLIGIDEKVTIVDTVAYSDLIQGKEYTLKGVLMDKATNKPFLVNGKEVRAEKTFTATAKSGSTTLEFTLDSMALAGKDVVVFEKVFRNGKEVVAHEDITDKGQTVTFDKPSIKTTATDKLTGTKLVGIDESVTIVDTVTYTDLIKGKSYTLTGVLMDKATNKPLLVSGKQVTATKTFVAADKKGSVTLEFTLNSLDLIGKEVVVFEKVLINNKEVTVHEDINDKDQTVEFVVPKIGTTAKDVETDSKRPSPEEPVTIRDTVAYSNLLKGKTYVLKGVLMDKETGEPLLIDGKEVRVVKEFVATDVKGTVDLDFTIDASTLAGKEVVVFEKLFRSNKEIAIHEDIEDEGQTVKFREPELQTTAMDKETNSKNPSPEDPVTIVDTVTYTDLIIGKEYTIKGTLMVKAEDGLTGTPLLVNGEEIHSEISFVAEEESGSIELEFTFDGSALAGEEVVVFEKLFRNDKEVVVHEDINDKNQTVTFRDPQIQTTATDKETGSKRPSPENPITLTDEVAYQDLITGEEYALQGILMDKETNSPLLIDGKQVTAERTFIAGEDNAETETPVLPVLENVAALAAGLGIEGEEAEEAVNLTLASGTVSLDFTFDASKLAGRTIVVFEKVLRNDKVVVSHEDIDDVEQTVEFKTPKIQTRAINKETNTQVMTPKTNVTITDRITYEDLVAGKEYTVKGVLMDKETNRPLLVNGKEVRAERTFVPSGESGTITLDFTFDGSALAGKEVVVFEKVLRNNKEVAVHEDITDMNQTVKFKVPTPVTYLPQTGEEIAIMGAILGLVLVALVGVIAWRRKQKEA